MDEDEKEMLSEARARLQNTKGECTYDQKQAATREGMAGCELDGNFPLSKPRLCLVLIRPIR